MPNTVRNAYAIHEGSPGMMSNYSQNERPKGTH